MELDKDQQTVLKRKNKLKDNKDSGLKVVASLRDQQIADLKTKLDNDKIGEHVVRLWQSANSDRAEWLSRQAKYLLELDEFINPIYKPALNWSSTLHVPAILTVVKTFHSRMFAALMDLDPPFTVRSRQAANVDRAILIEELMRYTLRDWCNEHNGVEEQVDRWIWDWCARGIGYLKARWHKKYTRFVDVEVEQVQNFKIEIDPETGEEIPTPYIEDIETEVSRTELVFSGPMLERVPVEDVVVIGGEGEPTRADAVIQQSWLTAGELFSLADQKVFDAEVVDKAIKSGRDYLSGHDETAEIKQRQIQMSGRSDLDQIDTTNRYKILEAYLKVDVDGSGVPAEVIVWVHEKTQQILRATYLRRVMPTGQNPFFKASFHLRHGTQDAVGLVEMLYSLGKELDAMHNITMDIGIISSMPFGFYRPTTASLKDEKLPLEPGALIPVDNPGQDVYFPNLGQRSGFGFQEQNAIQTYIDRLTSISDLNLGIIGGQGATRTATGTRALLGESSNNLNIYIKRMSRPWKQALQYIFTLLQNRIEPGMQFRILGDDGNAFWRTVKSKEELSGKFDFEVEANSASSNKQVMIEQANMIYQASQNPIDLQLGLITPTERYEAIAHMLKVNGVKDVSKYVRKPDQAPIKYSPIEIANRILAGIDVKLDPSQDLNGLVTLIEELIGDDTLMGQFNELQVQVLAMKRDEAMALLQALEQAAAQQAAASQQQMNAMAAQTPSNLQPVAINQQPNPGEGG